MASSLEEYYSTNYSRCNVSKNFLASWKGVAYPNHTFQFIALPFQFLAFYVILKKTPKSMKSMQLPLFVNHFLCALFDLSLCSLSTPYVFFPLLSGFGVGLLNWLEIPVLAQLIVVGVSGVCAVSSYTYLFESRSSCLMQNKFRISRPRMKFLYYSIVFLPYFLLAPVAYGIPKDQETAKLNALKTNPCPTEEFFNPPVLVLISDQKLIYFTNWVVAPLIGVHIVFHTFFHILCLVYYLYIAPPNNLSRDTKRNQRAFLLGIILQTSIPFLLGFIPAGIAFIAYRTNSYSQELGNLLMCCIGLHGIGESITILTVHKSYRKAVISLWWSTKSTTSFQVPPDLWNVTIERTKRFRT